jgi:hypothetical protein
MNQESRVDIFMFKSKDVDELVKEIDVFGCSQITLSYEFWHIFHVVFSNSWRVTGRTKGEYLEATFAKIQGGGTWPPTPPPPTPPPPIATIVDLEVVSWKL